MSQTLPPNQEEKRLAALRRYGILDTLPEVAFDELNRLASQVTNAPIAVIAFVDADRVWFKSRLRFDPPELPRREWFCSWAVQQPEVLAVPDTAMDERFRGLSLVLDEPHVRAYYGVPILTMDGYAIGTLAVAFPSPAALPDGVVETLRIAARQVMTQLELRRHLVQLSRIFEEQRRAEDALRTTEAFFQALVESLPQRIIRKDAQGRFTFASRNFCTELGRSLEEIRGRTDFDFFPEELARKYHEDDQRVMASRQVLEAVEEHLRPDGTKGFVQVVKIPLVDARSQVVGVQGIFWDVTEQRRTEQALAHERDLLRALLDHIPDRIFFKDAQSRFIRCSASMFSSLGFKNPEEVHGRSDFDYYPHDRAQEYYDEEQSIIRSGQPLINKVQKHGDGASQETWSSVTKVPIYNHRGTITGIVGLSRDITKLKQIENALRQTEEKYRNIVENSVEGFFQTTADGHYLTVNLALARLYGYDSTDALIHAMTDIQRQLYIDPNRREEFRKLIREKREVTGFESQIYRRDGSVIWISESARAVLDDQGALRFYEGSVEDITARKLAEQAKEAASEAALESARVKAQFLANMSHEFRTPLNAIIGNASVLLAGRLTEEQQELLEPICESAEALNRLINDILDFSKTEANKLTLESIDFDLHDTVEGTVEMLAQAARKQGDELLCHIASDVPQYLRGDPVRVRQVLMNLLSNAIKFTRHGEVTLRMYRVRDEGAMVRFRCEVQDTGIGIDDKSKPIIFQAFTQADGSTTRKFGGTGLGLTISKQIVGLMGGEIGFDSALGKGSTFWFELVLAPALSLPETETALPNMEPLRGRRLLVLDDHEGTARSLCDYASAMGCVAEPESSAAACAALLASSPDASLPELLLVDMEMSETDGLSFIRGLRSQPRFSGLRCVVLTNLGRRLELPVMRANGIIACLVKPVRRRRLAETLLSVLCAERPLDPLESESAEGAVPPLAARIPPGLRILLAEDNPVNQQVAFRMLRSLRLDADLATTGHEVIAALRRQPYDLVLLDCQMPEMDGYETARTITQIQSAGTSELKSSPRLIAVTANAMSGDREKCIAAGMHDYLSKPLKLESLAQAIERSARMLPASPAAVVPASEAAGTGDPGESMDLSVIQGLRDLREPGQPDPLRQLVEMFLKDSAHRLGLLEQAIRSADAAAVASPAHSLKGSSSNLGMKKLAGLAGEVEKHAKAGDLTAVTPLLDSLQKEFQRVQVFLSSEIER